MDRKTLTGLLLIAAILVLFSIFGPNQEAPEENETSDQDSIEQVEPIVEDLDTMPQEDNLVMQINEAGDPIIDSVKGTLYKDTLTDKDTFILEEAVVTTTIELDSNLEVKDVSKTLPYQEESFTLENDLLSIVVSNQGGRIKSAFLKEFQSYEDYMAESTEPLQLFDDTSSYGLIYKTGDTQINTDDLEFKVKNQTETAITLESNRNGKVIGFTYELKPGKYDLDFDIYFEGFTDAEVADIQFTSDFYLLSSEKHHPQEKRQATVYWQYEDDGYDYITHDSEEMEEDIEWLCFRSTFFTAILSNKTGFGHNNSSLSLIDYDEENTQTKYIKKYEADVNLGATKADNTVELNWYFGPVDYDILVDYDNGTEDIVELGTGLFRWINKYAIRPLFMWLIGTGMSLGLAILLLTVMVKLVLSPVNYKMYKSSAMMKVLKPQIEKIGKKYPKKEDAMKKQQETMALYKETGVSPLAGCIPMLIQMPILFAIFRLFPSAIELRQRSFLWAEDLSTYDQVASWEAHIPLLSDIYGNHISLFTLLMAVTTLLYTHYNSSNMQQPTQEGMPNLKYIMYFFPIMMIFFFNSYSSGLSFYYFISTLMTIIIMFSIKRFLIDDEKILAKIEANKANPKKKGKSKFQQRLEEAQKLQQERSKNRKKK